MVYDWGKAQYAWDIYHDDIDGWSLRCYDDDPEKPPTFRQWLDERRIGTRELAPFIWAVPRDDGMPDVQTWSELKAYLSSQQANLYAYRCARLLWPEYL